MTSLLPAWAGCPQSVLTSAAAAGFSSYSPPARGGLQSASYPFLPLVPHQRCKTMSSSLSLAPSGSCSSLDPPRKPWSRTTPHCHGSSLELGKSVRDLREFSCGPGVLFLL